MLSGESSLLPITSQNWRLFSPASFFFPNSLYFWATFRQPLLFNKKIFSPNYDLRNVSINFLVQLSLAQQIFYQLMQSLDQGIQPGDSFGGIRLV